MKLRLHHFLPQSRANGPGVRAVLWVQGCSLGCPGCFNPETHPFNRGQNVSVDDLFQRIADLTGTIEGVTLSGGEPLQQRVAVTELLRRVRIETSLSVILFTGFGWEEILSMGASKCRSVGVSECRSAVPAQRDRGPTLDCADMGAAHHLPNIAHTKRSPAPPLRLSPFLPNTATPPRRHPDTSADPAFLNYIDVLIAGRYDRTQRLAHALRGSANKTIHFLTTRYTPDDLESVPAAEIVVRPGGELLLSGIEPLQW
ncbi:MAG: radical SAM protein [Verrucomicrobia bacterium]|nr:radical SAM protein [Verrucomicrobiota bacterium]